MCGNFRTLSIFRHFIWECSVGPPTLLEGSTPLIALVSLGRGPLPFDLARVLEGLPLGILGRENSRPDAATLSKPQNPDRPMSSGKEEEMTQTNVEVIVGRLVTDEGFRRRFNDAPAATLQEEIDSGLVLNPCEQRALLAIDLRRADRFAEALDPCIQKVDLQREPS